MIAVKHIKPQVCELFSPDGESLGIINEYQFNDVRVQIKEQQLNGYYCLFNVDGTLKKLVLDKDGRSRDWSDGMFDFNEKLIIKLI